MDTPIPAKALADPVTLEIIKGNLRSAQLEMEALLERTAMSPVIREKKDFFAGYFDPLGQLITGTNLPLFGHIIQPFLEHYPSQTMRQGDLYWYNDCYASHGGVSHSPDQVFAAPVFFKDKLVGFSQSWAHFHDIGGAWPGSMSPKATDIFQEGIIIPPIRLYHEGVLNEEVFRIFLRNTRFPQEMQGDCRALVAAVRLGERRLIEMFERFGPEVVHDAFERLNEQTRNGVVRQLRDTFVPGSYAFADSIDSDGLGNGPFTIRMRLDVTKDKITIDATGTDDQAPGPVNFLMNPAVPRMIFGIHAMSNDPTLLINEGAMHAIDEVKLRPGSLLQPNFPAPLNQRGLTMIRTQNVCAGLMNVASGGQSVASSNAYAISFYRGKEPKTGRPFHVSDGLGVGHGARPFADGHDCVYYVAQENNPAEFIDIEFPARLLRYAVRTDSGGPGKFRGGTGVVRETMWLGHDAILATRFDGVVNPPWGVNGGRSAEPGRCFVNPGTPDEREVKSLEDGVVVRKGDIIRFETGGGGGWGHPFDRDPERVLNDVLGDYVSIEAARRDYGVVIDPDRLTVDAKATEDLRHRTRPESKLLHRRVYMDRME